MILNNNSCWFCFKESLPETLQHICGFDHTASDLLAIPARAFHNAGRAFDQVEEMAGKAFDKAGRAYDKAEEMAGRAIDKAEEMAGRAFDKAEEMARHAWEVMHHHHLPKWMRDNDFLIKGHRPQLNSFWECFKSIFRIHTETGNIWTHLLGECLYRIFDSPPPVKSDCVSIGLWVLYLDRIHVVK